MSARVLGAAAGLRRVLPRAAARAPRVIQPAIFVAGRRYASADAETFASEPAEPFAAKKSEKASIRAVEKQLEYISDPWVLGKHIEDLLAKDKFDDALKTVELASKKLVTVVSWNHLIDWLLKKQQIKRAVATFNNMKKRAQFPNAQTYTIMFRGLAKSDHPKNAVSEAVKLFSQLKNDRRLQPNTIHLNAVLSVCARAYDIDQLFIVAGELETLGLAPTTATYGVIFNGMRQYMWREYSDLDKVTKRANIDKMLARSKSIWVEVLDKWQNGKLKLDEALVCTMGRLQLLSKERKEKLRVLDLLEQTMNIPNLVTKGSKPSSAASQESSEADVVLHSRRRGGFVEPGPNTLALILTTLLTARQTSAAAPYWNLLVHDRKLVPDNDDWLRMIGVLKTSKSSAQAAQIVDTLPATGIDVQARSFGIAMEACVRDNINPNVMTHATRILHSMQARLAPTPDMHTMRLYLRVALVSHAAFRGRASTGDQVGAKAAYGRQIATALAELWHPYIELYNRHFKSEDVAAISSGSDKQAASLLYNNQKEVIALGRMMVGAFSKVVEEKMLPGNNNRDMIIASAKINKGVHAFFADIELRHPRLNPKATAARARSEAAAAEQGSPREEGLETEKKSPFVIDMPELDDKVDGGNAKHRSRTRQGGDFVWNTKKVGGGKDARNEQGGRNEDGPLIDRWVSPSLGKIEAVTQDQVHDEDFVSIKPVHEDTEVDAGSLPADKSKNPRTDRAVESDGSLWATLMEQRR